jgi:MptA/FolE2 family GTP cyclohydrolase
VQASADSRNVAIDDVGIRGLRYPLAIAGRNGAVQHTVAEIDLMVGLESEVKGTHMSRFVELVEAWKAPVDAASLAALAQSMTKRLGAERGTIDMRFPLFIRKQAPVSGVESLLDYQARARVTAAPEGTGVALSLTAPVTSLCPCSKEISEYGAHNQRSHVTIEASVDAGAPGFGFEDLASIAEGAASCEIYGLLKRPDEKYVTERAYDNPKFVEDLVRDIALTLAAHPAIIAYVVEAENFESIHNHSAYARIARRK